MTNRELQEELKKFPDSAIIQMSSKRTENDGAITITISVVKDIEINKFGKVITMYNYSEIKS